MLKVEKIGKLSDISFHLPKGYICGLIGENGAGKSTLIKILMGLYHSNGSVFIDGKDLREDEANAKEALGIIMQEDYFEPGMKVCNIGMFYGEMYKGFDNSQYLEYLNRFNIDKNKKYKALSRGMKIKLQLAFALSHNAKLFLFDEPTAGMDEHFREEFYKLCAQIVSTGERSILIASNITQDLERIADYIAYIQDARMLFYLTKEELSERFYIVNGEDYIVNLIEKDAVIYKEKGRYITKAMVIDSGCYPIDKRLEKTKPNIGEFMYYFVKGGRKNAENIAEKYLQN